MKIHTVKHAIMGATLGITLITLNSKKLEAAPTFDGVPVAATLLLHQALPIFTKAFPGLEASPTFSIGKNGHFYNEAGGFFGFYPSSCKVGIPIYEKLSELEEMRLGQALLLKPMVALLIISGDCKVGCATASLVRMQLFNVDKAKNPILDNSIWTYNFKSE